MCGSLCGYVWLSVWLSVIVPVSSVWLSVCVDVSENTCVSSTSSHAYNCVVVCG